MSHQFVPAQPTITMKKIKNQRTTTRVAVFAGAAAMMALTPNTHAQSSVDNLLNKLEQKGILTPNEARDLRTESDEEATNQMNNLPASKWKISDSIKSIQLFGDLRLRYEYRGVDNIPGAARETFYRERFRYALRAGIRATCPTISTTGFGWKPPPIRVRPGPPSATTPPAVR